ncbi:MAG: leucine-rich repeat domain-containing protein [Ruminococcus sp.]|uniref:leucine-rich repeat domain-containing protein n=1 Tax=Ruminococcus sp. TaxID=41978 RepID=UPI0026010FC1|nr:leucine-rich repeat domain-containing protein [Ruminococcus sp.]MBR0529465.1 leucine-rich repeat domain-containing protein [Ruminococcus sp.]
MKNKRLVAGLLALTFVFGGAVLPSGVVSNSVVASASASAEEYTYGDYVYVFSSKHNGIEIKQYTGLDEVVEIPDVIAGVKVTDIGYMSFAKNEYVKKIVIPDGVEYIGEGAFYKCTNLERIDLPDSVTFIDQGAFCETGNLNTIKLPDGITEIEMGTFSRSGIKSITLPNNLTTIHSAAFADCDCLESISLPESVTVFDDNAFAGSENLKIVKMPKKVKTIGGGVFHSCSGLESIQMPESVETFGNNVFYGCNSLKSISLPYGVTEISSVMFSRSDGVLEKVYLPDSVTKIDDAAFASMSKLEYVSIPDSVTYIGHAAFADCINLKNIHIPNDLSTIESCTFFNCQSLSSLDIPASVTDIGEDAFSYSVPETKTRKSLSNITLYIHKDSVAKQYALENSINFRVVDIEGKTRYPEISSVMHSADYHQFLVSWSSVSGAEKYGIAVQLAGKWRVQLYSNTPVITSPRLNPGDTYKLLIAAKVNGEWDLSNINSRAFTVTVK